MDKLPKRTPEEIDAHFKRVAYEQITGIHKQEAAKRNALAGIIAPDATVQQPVQDIISMARALLEASAPQPTPQASTATLPLPRSLETARTR